MSPRGILLLAALLLAGGAHAANLWDGGSAGPGDNNWSTGDNWDDNLVPTFPAALTFGGAARLATTNDLSGLLVSGVAFAPGAGAFVLRGNPITLSGNISNSVVVGSATNDQTVAIPITLSGNVSLVTTGGGGPPVGKGALVIDGAISGPYGITSYGKNFVQLNGANTYTGETIITSASGDSYFSIGSASAFGTGRVRVGASSGASQIWLQSCGNLTITNTIEVRTQRFIAANYTVAGRAGGSLTLNGDVILNQGNSGQDFWCQSPLTINGTVSGGNLNGFRFASGTVHLRGVNTFTNHLHSSYLLSVPTVSINSDAAMGHTNNGVRAVFTMNFQTASGSTIFLAPSRTFVVSAYRTLTFDIPTTSSLTIPGLVSGNAIAKSGAGTLFLTGTNTYSGGTSISGGILNAITNAALGAESGSVNFTGAGTFQPGMTPFTLPASRTINLTNAGTYTAAFDVPTNYTLTVAGLIKGNAATNSSLSKTGAGALVLTGGSGDTALGGLNVLGGKVTIQSGVWQVAPAQTADGTVFNVLGGATYEQTGGTNYLPVYSCISQQFIGGAYTNLTSVGILSGGLLSGMELMVGRRNSAVMTISGNALLDLYSFKLGEMPGYTTVCNLDGGVVYCNYIATRATNTTQSTAILNFNGGTLRARNTAGTPNIIGGFGSGSVSFLNQVNVKRGGAYIDSQSYAVAIPQVLSHDAELGIEPDGGLTKRGSGTLTLSTTNTYTGVTTVEAGAVKLGVANTLWPSSSVLVSSGAVFDVNGQAQTLAGLGGSGLVTNNATLSVTAGVAPGGTNAVGTLTLAVKPALLAGTLLADVASDGSCDRLHSAGALDLTSLGLLIANPSDLNKHARYVVASCAGALTAPFQSVSLPNRWHVSYDAAAREAIVSYNFGTLLMVQ